MRVRKTFSVSLDEVRAMLEERHPFLKRLTGADAFTVRLVDGRFATLDPEKDPINNGPARIDVTWEENEIEDWGPPKGAKP